MSPWFVDLLLLSCAINLPKTVHGAATTTFEELPTVKLSYGSFQGATVGDIVTFLGMPFATPPLGRLRFAPPELPIPFSGIRPATAFGAACLQPEEVFPANPGVNISFPGPVNKSEDCLFINVVKPVSIPAGKKLPVLFWIYGGGFEVGDTSLNPGNTVVERSIALNEPIIYVSANYRVNALGFLGGKEVKAAGIGNVGLRDQRFAMQWVQRNIALFGGDPTKVTIWGQSAGAASVGLQMLLNDGNPHGLFRAAFMESGSPIPLKDITAQQQSFDQLVSDTGCTGSFDKISCLRSIPSDKLRTVINAFPSVFSFSSLRFSWSPSIDGQFIVRDSQVSILKGLYAKVPFVTGDCDDEGTLFSFASLNITNNDEFLHYVQANYLTGINATQLAAVGNAYPDDITQGSPFDTGTANALTPEFKRIAAFQGDWIFQAPRRFFLQVASKTQPAFAYLFKRGKATPFLGSSHGSDLTEFYGSGDLPDFIGTDALVNFANTLNPTTPSNSASLLSMSGLEWKEWSSSARAPPMLTFLDPSPLLAITADTFRAEAMDLLISISLKLDGNN
ncbi:sterol esterase [Crucibulum laeve]|uniref:Carboxylic ester hydrolase n=1 Tax=Crucibulum laeve TaxID=68775 RepID=A0A5C3LH71_9AGAR|nr:sterol esterase [Crucibulum laeve]